MFLFFIGCGGETRLKIQKNNAFQLSCEGKYITEIVSCSSGAPVCGTKPGSEKPEVYCIDSKNTILPGEAFCEDLLNNKERLSTRPTCERTLSSILKNVL